MMTVMRSKTRRAILTAVAFCAGVQSGCESQQVVLSPEPAARILSLRDVPEPENLTVTVRLVRASSSQEEITDDVQTQDGFSSQRGQSVVISVPLEEQARERRQQDGTWSIERFDSTDDTNSITEFRTTGYFNQAEAQIERSLLAKGFSLLDRSKFEAKLREERSSQQVYQSDLTESEKAEVLSLVSERESGLITADEYELRRADLEEQHKQVREAERSEVGRTELTDMAELIRATEGGEDRADFILHVDAFTIRPSSEESLDLLTLDEVRDRCTEHPGLRQAIARSGLETVAKPGFTATLDSSLVRVESGEIVWLGSHRVHTRHVLPDGITIVLPITRFVDNGTDTNGAITSFNDRQQQRSEECLRLKKEIEGKMASGRFKNRQERDAAIAEYDEACARMKAESVAAPALATARWSRAYRVERPLVRPELPTSEDVDRLSREMEAARTTQEQNRIRREYRQYQEFLADHFKSLAALVSRELVGTIPTE